MFCNVIVTRPFDQIFTYKLKKGQIIKEGSIVSVPFGKSNNQIGMVESVSKNLNLNNNYKIKEVEKVFDSIILNTNIIKFIYWISDYTLSPIGLVLKLFIINEKIINFSIKEKKENIYIPDKIKLNDDQKIARATINKLLLKPTHPLVLEGVTGSGKTEVFFEAVETVIKKKQQALIMVPEISLTPQLETRFLKRFGFLPNIWHSKISEKNRKEIWHRSYLGESMIVVGARSSLFLPFKKLGLIVVDEEHDGSYKQEDNIRYQARDLAIVRGKIDNTLVILSSATPSLETQNNINKKKYKHVFLPSQFSGTKLPPIELIDLQKNKLEKNKWISNKIYEELKNCLVKKEQALLFLNRRGYSPLSLCIECGYRYQCEQCTSWLVMHHEKKRLLCHHCGSIHSIDPNCPKCLKKDSIKLIGPGVERVKEELNILFPEKSIGIMSSDNANTPKKIKKIINDFENKKIDILVATQIMAKGYDFPNLSFVGVIDADTGLLGGDMRAIEKTFNLLQQVSGRAGRAKKQGKVFIQTYYPKQPIITSLQKRDRKKFIEQSLKDREDFMIPPFGFMTSLIISGSSKAKTEMYGKKIVQLSKIPENLNILGPVEAPIFLLRGLYRFRILIKGNNRKILNKFTRFILKKCPAPTSIKLIVDVDPYSFM
jgi:primosomal protein N' (replication factor Y) (superfamily II helicase)